MRTTYRDGRTARALKLVLAASAAFLALAPKAQADQGGVSFWLSGQFASLTSTPPSPGFSLVLLPYTFSGSAGASKSFQIGNQVVAGVKATVDLLVFQPGYAPSEPILGGQARVALGWGPGYNKTSAALALSNTPLALSLTDSVNGIDSHLDWAASQMLSANWQVGVIGYVYDQLSGDSGSGNLVGSFESKVASIGLEAGYVFAVANRPAYLNLRGYYEFWAEHRVRGRALFATLSIPIGASSPVRPNSP